MDDDHIGTEQLLAARNALAQDLAVVDDELQVEVRDPDAGVAVARRRLADVTSAAAEAEVATLDGVEEERSVDLPGGCGNERRVALELGEPEAGTQRGDHGADEVGQDVLRVVQLDICEVSGVAGDVGDQEARGLGAGKHADCEPRLGRAPGLGTHSTKLRLSDAKG
jgi:hypothetical protein